MRRFLKSIPVMLCIFLIIQNRALAGDISKFKIEPSYSWQLSEPDAEHLFTGIRQLRYGDSISKVKKSLGQPSKDSEAIDKKGHFLAYELLYPIKRIKPEGGNVYDQEVSLDFDMQKRLFQINYNAMLPLTGNVIRRGIESQTGVTFFVTRPYQNQSK